MSFDIAQLQQGWPTPQVPVPVVIFGAGSIVADAHLPAYKLANIPVAGLFDPDTQKAQALCSQWGIECYTSAEQAIEQGIAQANAPANAQTWLPVSLF